MPKPVSIALYERYKEEVWQLTNAKQRFEPGKKNRGLTDREIAGRLGLAVEDVTEIRTIVENEKIPIQHYLEADAIKEERFARIPAKK
ncbi:MAG: hypothetical protein JW821_05150 [Deltaproteobacteria bacterium]|nr:hypothetical protein [Deltaproteobacteria bacterium]